MSAADIAVLFDFDGTLADTAPDMIAALNAWLGERRRAPVPAAALRPLCSGGSRALLNYCGIGDEDMDAAVADYLNHYEQTGYCHTTLFAGIDELLGQLAGANICWGVATNKPQRHFAPIAERLLAAYQPAALIARNDRLPPKPHPATLLAALRQCGAARALYVGDDLRDGRAAQAAEMPFIAVTWGYWRSEQWQGKDSPPIDTLLSAPEQLPAALAAHGLAF